MPDSQNELPFDNRPTKTSLTGTVDYFIYAKARFPRLTKPRSVKDAIKKFRLPVARIGHSLIVNVEQADARLAEIALEQMEEAKARAEAQPQQRAEPEPRRPGRAAATIEVPTPPRRRGRPKGSRNRPKVPIEPVKADLELLDP
jgi:hypothetical protein